MNKSIFRPADILIPQGIPLEAWSVIACDQFSSDKSYWERVRVNAGAYPSTLNMIIPEAYLGEISEEEGTAKIQAVMEEYDTRGLFGEINDSFVYVERTLEDGRIRRGLVGKLDLEEYDFSGGAANILASENTVLNRLPPRIRVRRAARLELPHVMAFIDDREMSVIEPLARKSAELQVLYDFRLMEGGGHIKGMRIHGSGAEEVENAVCALGEKGGPLMIIGDGNHSLAAAKVFWDEMKQNLSADEREIHPARFALIEVNNVYDSAVSFEAIHRVIFGADTGAFVRELESAVPNGEDYKLHWLSHEGEGTIGVSAGYFGDVITPLQTFIDDYVSRTGCRVDYIHGSDSVRELVSKKDSIGLILPAMDKSDFFETVTKRGVFPKKSFSVGHARDKRYYLECRRIK